MHVNRFFIKLNLYKRQYCACLGLHHHAPSMSFACKPCFMFHLLRGLFRSRTADADIEFKFIQGRHNIRQYRGRRRGHWNANRLLGLWQWGKEIGRDDNASKPLQFVKKAALCHKAGMDFNTSGATALKRIIFRNGRKEIVSCRMTCVKTMSYLQTWRFSGYCCVFQRGPLTCAGLWQTFNVSDVKSGAKSSSVYQKLHSGPVAHTHFLHGSLPSRVVSSAHVFR